MISLLSTVTRGSRGLMTGHLLTIGKLAAYSGCKVQTIRYYEHIGLLPPPPRSVGNHRVYGPEHVRRLAFIRHGRELGFPLDAIRELLALSDEPDQSCEEVTQIARRHLTGGRKSNCPSDFPQD